MAISEAQLDTWDRLGFGHTIAGDIRLGQRRTRSQQCPLHRAQVRRYSCKGRTATTPTSTPTAMWMSR